MQFFKTVKKLNLRLKLLIYEQNLLYPGQLIHLKTQRNFPNKRVDVSAGVSIPQ